jgi:mannose-1-phosphate guanylyltransferase/mannose-6-phosphate isomerase
MHRKLWGVVLAGGDGTRLKTLSRFISGDDRPKQFCALFGGETLLRQTRTRIAPAVPAEHTMFAVVKGHEPFYRKELAGVDESRIVVQPANRGTGTAILYSLFRLMRFDDDPLVAFFPTDHDYADDRRFAQSVETAARFARQYPDWLVILGAHAERAEMQYGWIEQGERIESDKPVFLVNRFWEKPSSRVAEDLLRKGCLWNTFVLIGRARTFLDALAAATPAMWQALDPLKAPPAHSEFELASQIYDGLPASDFSRQVLTTCTERLAVLGLGEVGWSDLGTPERVRAAAEMRAHAWLQVGARR